MVCVLLGSIYVEGSVAGLLGTLRSGNEREPENIASNRAGLDTVT